MWIWESETVDVTAPTGQVQTVTLRRSEIDPLPFFGGLGLCFCFGTAVVGLAGIPIYFAAGWKLPETTTVNFSPGAVALPSTGPKVAVVRRRERGVTY